MTSSQMPLTAGEPGHRWWILAVLATAQLMVALDAFWVAAAILTAAALAVAPLLRPGLAELGVSAARPDTRPRGVTTDRHTQPSVAEMAADGAPACVELKGAS
jgi:hypothetical protein